MATAMTFGERLRSWRERRMLTQAELAERIGVHTSQLSHWEADRHRPRSRRQRQLCEALDISADDLFGPQGQSEHDHKASKVDGNVEE